MFRSDTVFPKVSAQRGINVTVTPWKGYLTLLLATNASLTALRDASIPAPKQKAAPCVWERVMGRAATNIVTLMAMGIADKGRQLKLALFDSYHPELHYMRGPGPKWREKHGQMTVTSSIRDLGVPALWRAGV